MKRTSYITGLAAERMCRFVLRLKFYRILAERYKTPMGEADIIARRGNVVIAIEVKARTTHQAAFESISTQQQMRVANALEDFIMRNPHFAKADRRFDVMIVTPKKWPLHVRNAWHL